MIIISNDYVVTTMCVGDDLHGGNNTRSKFIYKRDCE